jgi:hypothetical protein
MPIAVSGSNIVFADGSSIASGFTGFKNRIINGAMTIDQRNAGSSTTPTTNATYSLDRWKNALTQSSKFSVQQDAGAVTPPAGFTDYLGITSTSSYSVLSTDLFGIQQGIEGYNIGDLNWGTANAKTVTLSFWVRSSLTGTFGGSITDSAGIYTYVFGYTINASNTWEQKSITIAGPTSGGSWGSTNGAGLYLSMSIGAGSNYTTTTNTWLSGAFYIQPTGSTSVVGTNGATWYITGVQLEAGSSATSFEYRPYTTELGLCYRYCYALYKGDNIYYGIAGYYTSTDLRTQIQMPVNMRTTPTISYTGYSQVWRNGTSDANNVNGWSVVLSCPNTVHLTSTNNMSGTAGQIGWLYGAGGGQLIFLAEL